MKLAKIEDNCHTCSTLFRKLEACPRYLWTGYEDSTLDIIVLYTLDTGMVILSISPYVLGIFIMLVAIGYRRNNFICMASLVVIQYVVCQILKMIIKQRRPSGTRHLHSVLLSRVVIRHAQSTCFFHSDLVYLVHFEAAVQ